MLMLSKKYKINEKYLSYIGISEDKDYDLIPKLDMKNEIIYTEDRILKLKNILRLVIIFYNKLKYSGGISKFSNENFGNVIHTFVKQNGKLNDLNKLKDLPYNFNDLIKYYNNNIKLEDLINIIINIIYNTIYFILEQANGSIQIVVTNFVEFLLKRIMEFDEIYSSYNLLQLKREKEEDIMQQDAGENNLDMNYYQDLDDDEVDLQGDFEINYDAFDLDLVDAEQGDFDAYNEQ